MRRLLWILPLLFLATVALAADVGVFQRSDCTTLTPATGKTFCFDQTANALKLWDGTAWVSVVGGQALPSSALANLPAAGIAGRLADVTDSIGGIHKDTGLQWIQTNGKVINLTDRPFGARSATNPVVDPNEFATANSAALAAAYAALPSPIGGIIIIPAGWYAFDSNWALTTAQKPVTVIGAGAKVAVSAQYGNAQWPDAANASGTILFYTPVDASQAITASVAGTSFRDLALIGAGVGNGIGFDIGSFAHSKLFDNVVVANFLTGISLTGTQSTVSYNVWLRGNQTGIHWVNGNTTNNTFYGLFMEGNGRNASTGDSFLHTAGSGNTIIGGVMQGGRGGRIVDGTLFTIEHFWYENNDNDAITATGTINQMRLLNLIEGGGTAGAINLSPAGGSFVVAYSRIPSKTFVLGANGEALLLANSISNKSLLGAYLEILASNPPRIATLSTAPLDFAESVVMANNKAYRAKLVSGALADVIKMNASNVVILGPENTEARIKAGWNSGTLYSLEIIPGGLADLGVAIELRVNTSGAPGIGTLRSVVVGAPDSGGAGFRVLKVPN